MKTIRKTLILLMVIICTSKIYAIEVQSYIISNNNDTLYGTIKISKFNLLQKTVSVTSYNTDELFYHLFFKSSSEKRYKELFPTDVKEYGFFLDNTPYRFISTEEKPVITKHNRAKFYLQVAGGSINLFEYRTTVDYENQNQPTNKYLGNHSLKIREEFILSDDNKLVKVEDNGGSVSDFLLANIKLNKEILDKVCKDKSFKDMREVIRLYNQYTN
jgi:hypothetical protein